MGDRVVIGFMPGRVEGPSRTARQATASRTTAPTAPAVEAPASTECLSNPSARPSAPGADALIDHHALPDWSVEARSHADGSGVDLAVAVAGSGTLNETLKAVRHEGRISPTGFDRPTATAGIPRERITLQGIHAGSVETLRAFARIGIRPVIGRVFAFSRVAEACSMLAGSGYFGKTVIQIPNAAPGILRVAA